MHIRRGNNTQRPEKSILVVLKLVKAGHRRVAQRLCCRECRRSFDRRAIRNLCPPFSSLPRPPLCSGFCLARGAHSPELALTRARSPRRAPGRTSRCGRPSSPRSGPSAAPRRRRSSCRRWRSAASSRTPPPSTPSSTPGAPPRTHHATSPMIRSLPGRRQGPVLSRLPLLSSTLCVRRCAAGDFRRAELCYARMLKAGAPPPPRGARVMPALRPRALAPPQPGPLRSPFLTCSPTHPAPAQASSPTAPPTLPSSRSSRRRARSSRRSASWCGHFSNQHRQSLLSPLCPSSLVNLASELALALCFSS